MAFVFFSFFLFTRKVVSLASRVEYDVFVRAWYGDSGLRWRLCLACHIFLLYTMGVQYHGGT